MKVYVDRARCEAHGRCHFEDGTLFPLDDDGYTSLSDGTDVPAESSDAAQRGVDACPMGALRLS